MRDEPIDPNQKWFVIRGGVRAAILERPVWEDMFWFSYEVIALPESPEPVYVAEFWRDTFDVENEWGARISNVWAGKIQPRAPGERVWLRGFRPYRHKSADPPRSSTSWTSRLWSRLRRFAK